MKRKTSYFDTDYLLVIILLVFSGDPITRFMGKFILPVLSMVIFVAMYKRMKKDFYIAFLCVTAAMLLLFTCQYFILGYVSWLGSFNYINTIFFGGMIIYLLGDRLSYKFFVIMSYIATISLILFIPLNLLSIHVPGFEWKPDRITYIIYTFVEQHHYRNCGLFWEPGAFSGILILCIALNIRQLPQLWKYHKFKVFVIVLALITTQSTTGYLILFVIGSYFLLFFVKDKTIAFTMLPLLLIVGIVVYTNAAFLADKVEHQSESTAVLDKGEFSNSRFGSFVFDMTYIKKHPVIGNGFNEITRYADNPEIIQLIQMGQDPANGNGLSNFMACLGIPFVFIYILLSYKAMLTIDKKVAILVTLVITLSLISEQWLTYPLFTGIIFFTNKKKFFNGSNQYSRVTNLPQPQRQNFNVS